MKNNKILYYSGIIISVLIIICVIFFLILQKSSDNQLNNTVEIIGEEDNGDSLQLANNPMDKNVEESEKELEFSEIPEDDEAVEENNLVEVQNNQEMEKSVVEEQTLDPDFVMPLEGEILRDYAKDKLVYSDTLKEWVTHTGIDIKAPKTTIVKSSAKGKVVAIKNDPRFGLSVVIEHTNGYSTIYSNLLTAEFVSIGEEIEQGETIGTVGNTAAFEILDEPHLHFEIHKDGVPVDPNMYL